jgi:hypothetical protein
MVIFGLPLFISYDVYSTFVATNFSYAISNDFMYIGYLIINGMYLFGLYLFCKLSYKIIITLINHFI